MNISPIANLNAGGQTGAKTAQFTYRSCHDTIRTHILNWSQSCRNRIFGTAVRFQPGQIPAVLFPGRVTTCQDKSGSGFWPVLEPNRTEPQVKTRTAGGLPGPVANTSFNFSDEDEDRTIRITMDGNMQHARLKRHTLWDFEIFEPKLFVDYGRKKFDLTTSANDQVNTIIPSNACGHKFKATDGWN
jgi:hypothetical protein